MTYDYDLVILGGGNAISVARLCGAAGMRVALVEKGPLGGTCPHRGCIPSKLLIGYADAARHVRRAGLFHADATLGRIDHSAILKETFDYIGQFDAAAEKGLPKSVALFRGHGRLVDNRTVEVDGATIHGRQIVLATGSRPRRPGLSGLDGVPYWTSDDVFAMDTMPKIPSSITIVGGGYIACELAHFFDGVGVDTTLVVRGHGLLKNEDDEIAAVFQAAFTSRIPTLFGSSVESVSHDGRSFDITIRQGDTVQRRQSQALLFAIGRVPNTDDIGLENTDLESNKHGFIESDQCLRTNVDGVYTLGDIAGKFMFTHAANFEAEYLARSLIDGTAEPIDYGPMPHAVFSEPEIAGVGPTEQALIDKGTPYVAAALPFDAVTKGRAIKEEHGCCKFLVSPEGRILGCHIVGQQASVLLHEVLPFMRWNNDVRAIASMIHIHPSLPEVVRSTARKAVSLLGEG